MYSEEITIPKDAKEQVKLIRKIIKSKVKTVSVKMGTGTAWGWVEIWGSGPYSRFTETEQAALKTLEIDAGCSNCYVISPEDRKSYLLGWLN